MKFIIKITGVLATAAVFASCTIENDVRSTQDYFNVDVEPQRESIVIKASSEVITAIN